MGTLDREEVLAFYKGRVKIKRTSLQWATECVECGRRSPWVHAWQKAVEAARAHLRATGHWEFDMLCRLQSVHGERLELEDRLWEAWREE
jgi:hypothetical protein